MKRRSDGYEFAELRGYVAGDDPRRIDWAATARAGALQTRVVFEDHALTLAAVLDASASMFVGRTRSNYELAAEVAASWFGAAIDDDRCARVEDGKPDLRPGFARPDRGAPLRRAPRSPRRVLRERAGYGAGGPVARRAPLDRLGLLADGGARAASAGLRRALRVDRALDARSLARRSAAAAGSCACGMPPAARRCAATSESRADALRRGGRRARRPHPARRCTSAGCAPARSTSAAAKRRAAGRVRARARSVVFAPTAGRWPGFCC